MALSQNQREGKNALLDLRSPLNGGDAMSRTVEHGKGGERRSGGMESGGEETETLRQREGFIFAKCRGLQRGVVTH